MLVSLNVAALNLCAALTVGTQKHHHLAGSPIKDGWMKGWINRRQVELPAGQTAGVAVAARCGHRRASLF